MNEKRCLVTGVNGQLGYRIVENLQKKGYQNIFAPDRAKMNLSNLEEVKQVVEDYKPDVVFHGAAYTSVDEAENSEVAFELCHRINVEATAVIAKCCQKLGSDLVYVSSDYVFDGEKPLTETYESTDQMNSKSVYGKSKQDGEEMVREIMTSNQYYIARVNGTFDERGNNFVKTMINIGLRFPEITVVSDQIVCPTPAKDIAISLIELTEQKNYGTHHVVSPGYLSWFEFANSIFANYDEMRTEEERQNNPLANIKPVTTEEYNAKQNKKIAPRPKNSQLKPTVNLPERNHIINDICMLDLSTRRGQKGYTKLKK